MCLCSSKVLITATGGARGKKPIELKKIADAALDISKKNGFQVRIPYRCGLSVDILTKLLDAMPSLCLGSLPISRITGQSTPSQGIAVRSPL